MNLKFLSLLLPLMGVYVDAFAVKMEVKDISLQEITCDRRSPFLLNKPEGTCLKVPENTLELTLSLEAGEPQENLENVHIVLQDKGENFQYNTGGQGGWTKFAFNEFSSGAIPLPASFSRLPFEKNSIIRSIHLDEFTNRKGAMMFIGVRSNAQLGFKDGMVKKVFDVR